MFLPLETLTSLIRSGLPILVELLDLVNSVIIFFISNELTQMTNFPTRIPDCDSQSCSFGFISFFCISSYIFLRQYLLYNGFPSIGKLWSCYCLSFHWLSIKFNALFHRIAYDYSCTDWDGLCDHFRDAQWEDNFKLDASAAASEFCVWIQAGIDVHIPHRKYEFKPPSSPWFSAACTAAIVHRNHFFSLYQKNKPWNSKVKFIRTSNHCKMVLEGAKLAYANNFPETWLSGLCANH